MCDPPYQELANYSSNLGKIWPAALLLYSQHTENGFLHFHSIGVVRQHRDSLIIIFTTGPFTDKMY